MNSHKRKADDEGALSTPDMERAWLKTRTNARRTRDPIPDPPASPSPKPRTIKRSLRISPDWKLLGGIVQSSDFDLRANTHDSENLSPGFVVQASDSTFGEGINDTNHFFDLKSANDTTVDTETDPNILLGDAKSCAGSISSTHDVYPVPNSVNATPLSQSPPLAEDHQSSDSQFEHSDEMGKRKRDPSPGNIFPQTMEDAFSRATPAFTSRNNAGIQKSSPSQYTFETQTLHNAVTQPTLKTQRSQGPVPEIFTDTDTKPGFVLQIPFETPILPNCVSQTTFQASMAASALNNGCPPQMHNFVPAKTALDIGRTSQMSVSFPHSTALNTGRPPAMHDNLPRLLPRSLPLNDPNRPEVLLSNDPQNNRSLRVGDRVYLLDENRSDDGDALWTITGLTHQGAFVITPIATPLYCPQPGRLMRAPLILGDVVSVYSHQIEIDMNGQQVFKDVKIGYGSVTRRYVVNGVRKYDVLSDDPMYSGLVYEGLDDTEIGMYEMADQIGSVAVIPGGNAHYGQPGFGPV